MDYFLILFSLVLVASFSILTKSIYQDRKLKKEDPFRYFFYVILCGSVALAFSLLIIQEVFKLDPWSNPAGQAIAILLIEILFGTAGVLFCVVGIKAIKEKKSLISSPFGAQEIEGAPSIIWGIVVLSIGVLWILSQIYITSLAI